MHNGANKIFPRTKRIRTTNQSKRKTHMGTILRKNNKKKEVFTKWE